MIDSEEDTFIKILIYASMPCFFMEHDLLIFHCGGGMSTVTLIANLQSGEGNGTL